MIQARGELLREPGKKGRRAAAAYLRPRTVERAWELFQSGSEMDAQDLMPQADPQHRNIRRQAAQQAEGSPVAGIVHHARTGGERMTFSPFRTACSRPGESWGTTRGTAMPVAAASSARFQVKESR